MILGRLLSALFDSGVVFVMTSNYPPDELWPHGLLRERFLPTIALIKQWLDIVEVDAGVDYRLRALEHVEAFHVPCRRSGRCGDDPRRSKRCGGGPDEDPQLTIDGRPLSARRRAGSVVWFDFAALCDGPRSQRDYLELARRFAVVLSRISRGWAWTPPTRPGASRCSIDILYDHRVKLVASAAAPADALYAKDRNAREFPRTVSRLMEMRTRDYMALPHVTDGDAGAPAG